MKSLKDRLQRIQVEEPVHIPTLDGSAIAETVQVKVPAWRDPKDGEIYLDGEAAEILDRVKARYLGLLTPEQIKALRQRLNLKQKDLTELLQIGEKTWSRWETGRERPSRSINLLLFALHEGALDIAYLRHLARRRADWTHLAAVAAESGAGWNLAQNVAERWAEFTQQADQMPRQRALIETPANPRLIWSTSGRGHTWAPVQESPSPASEQPTASFHPRLDFAKAVADLGLASQG